MNITILDENREAVHILDSYESLIWADRYSESGDFEIYTSANEALLNIAKRDRYVVNPESDHVMIVETIHINTDAEDGSHITLQGNSLERILERRIIWGYKEISTTATNEETGELLYQTLEDVVESLLNDCIIKPTDENRKIDGFIFKRSEDPAITSLKAFDAQYMGDNLYTVVVNICNDNKIGFKITLDDDRNFVFELYAGKDRSYDQSENPYVIFSPSFDNLIDANYMETRSALKTTALVVGGVGLIGSILGSEKDRPTYEVNTHEDLTGINRRELYVDARDISSDSEDNAKKLQRGKEKLSEYTDISSFEGRAETRIMFKYGEDFFTGDIVQFADEYGHEAPARIVEMITSDSGEGLSVYPTFKMIQKDSETEGEQTQ